MARQVLPIVGAVVGAFFGNPQLGYAIGAMVGNAVDPLRVKTPRLQEIPSQTASEGGFRQVVYGTSWVNSTNIIDFSQVRRVTVEERTGKGGGPIVESERLYRTFAIGLGEPAQTLRVIRMDGKVVFDARPGSTMLAESLDFSSRFRFYTGAEDQLPDPDLEALPTNGIGNTPAYRGTSYVVFPDYDLTDVQGRIPTIEVELIRELTDEVSKVSLLTDVRHYSGPVSGLEVASTDIGFAPGINRVRLSAGGGYACGFTDGNAGLDMRKYDQDSQTWSAITPPSAAGDVRSIDWGPLYQNSDSQYFVVGHGTRATIYSRSGDTFTQVFETADFGVNVFRVRWDAVGQRLCVVLSASDDSLRVYDFVQNALVNEKAIGSPGTNFVGGAPYAVEFLPYLGSRYLACSNPTHTFVVRADEDDLPIAAASGGPGGAGIFWDASGGYLVGADNDQVRIWSFDSSILGAEQLTLESMTDLGNRSTSDAAISGDRRYLAMAAGINSPIIVDLGTVLPPMPVELSLPPSAGAAVQSVSFPARAALPQYDAGTVILSDLIEEICDRCGLDSAKLDVSELTDQVAGVTLGGAYDGAGAITMLMPPYHFDMYEADRLLHFPKRGAAVKATITENDLIQEPDESTLRGQDIEYPRYLLLKYLNPGQNYAAPAAVVQRNSPDIRVKGEAIAELPVSFDETGALRVADRMLKVMWEDLNGEAVFSLPSGPFAWLTPSDCLGLGLRGALYRVRVEKVEYAAGVLKVTARRDRQSAYTSNLTAIPLPAPTPPPTTIAGATQFVVLNIPGIVDGDDPLLGVRVGVAGLAESAWTGCSVRWSNDGGANWNFLANVTTRARMGNLIAPLAGASPHYTDNTNSISLVMLDDRELETISESHFLSEGNPAAISRADGTAEIIQFKTVTDEGSREWTLETLHRGRLDTDASEHLAGAKFVMLDGTVFLPLPSSLIGQTITLQFVSFGTSPEMAPSFTFTWQPPYSQYEWAPADLSLGRGGGVITASWSPRHRFGTDDFPIRASTTEGWLLTATDGVTTTSHPSSFTEISIPDVFSGPVTVSVSQVNRFTGAGPAISEVIP